MSPIPAISPSLSGMMPVTGADGSSLNSILGSSMPNVDAVPPDTSPLPSSGIQMPAELAAPEGITSVHLAGTSFDSMLGQFVSEVNAQSAASAQAVSALQSGQSIPLHKAVIAMEEANVSFQLMVEVRNRMLDAYQEIMRMQM